VDLVDFSLSSRLSTFEMDQVGSFKLQKGPIFLSDNEARVDSVDTKKLSRYDIFTTFLHFLAVSLSTAGIGSLTWAYVVVQGCDRTNRSMPPFHEEFLENFVPVIALVCSYITTRTP
jgi:hypothetical protein